MRLSDEQSRQVIVSALQRARAIGSPVTVAVVDSGGFLVGLERMTGARPLTPRLAMAKAYSAAVMERPTSDLRDWQSRDPGFFAQVGRMGEHPIVATEGGVPIKFDGSVVGAVGVAGAAPAQDQEIAETALLESGYELVFEAFPKLLAP
jgi:uncharacterized protein GlcG (DUF336 family)